MAAPRWLKGRALPGIFKSLPQLLAKHSNLLIEVRRAIAKGGNGGRGRCLDYHQLPFDVFLALRRPAAGLRGFWRGVCG